MSRRSAHQSPVEVEDSESSSEASDEEEQHERRPVRRAERVSLGRSGEVGRKRRWMTIYTASCLTLHVYLWPGQVCLSMQLRCEDVEYAHCSTPHAAALALQALN